MKLRLCRAAACFSGALACTAGLSTALADGIPAIPEVFLRLAKEGRFPDNVCFDAGTSPEYVAAIERLRELSEGDDQDPPGYQLTTRWPGVTGDPIDLSYSIVPDGLIADGDASTFFSTMDAQYATLGGREEWLSRIDASFERWEELSGINFTRVTAAGVDWDDGSSWGTSGNDTTRGDIRLSMTPIDGPSNTLAYAQFPSGGDIVVDNAESWTSDTFLLNVIAHETGHALGMLHVCPDNGTKLMEPFANTFFEGPQHDDIRGIQRYYGDIHEGNNTSTVAPLLGTFNSDGVYSLGIPPGADTNSGSQLSLDADGEVDYFKFHVDYSGKVDVFVTPLGFLYEQGPQTGDCSTGTDVDSGDIANIGIELRDSDGVTILASANVNGVGLFELLNDVVLDSPGDYFLRVFESNSFSVVQLYRFSLTFDLDAPPPIDSDGDGVGDDTDDCPGTADGSPVDSNGCACEQLDADDDGVDNCGDLCADTPGNETPNGDGCSPSQLDSDDDGVNDAADDCPGTANGSPVDSNGCACEQLDADDDGVDNCDDLCAGTPGNETPDGDGCGPSQLDSDDDGVNDALDLCPGTAPGTPVDADGCPLPTGCDGDANGDGTVDPLDAGYVSARFGCSVGGGDPACDAADVNVDTVVDPLDVGYVLARFGGCP